MQLDRNLAITRVLGLMAREPLSRLRTLTMRGNTPVNFVVLRGAKSSGGRQRLRVICREHKPRIADLRPVIQRLDAKVATSPAPAQLGHDLRWADLTGMEWQ